MLHLPINYAYSSCFKLWTLSLYTKEGVSLKASPYYHNQIVCRSLIASRDGPTCSKRSNDTHMDSESS